MPAVKKKEKKKTKEKVKIVGERGSKNAIRFWQKGGTKIVWRG